MNSSIALRLLWKEYRVQRGLWLSMAFGCFALQALIAYLVQSEQESFQGILPVAFMLTGFYAIGSGAITFSIEREEGTQLRPVMLGCPPGLTLTVKTIFGVVTTALLLAITLSSGMLMTLGSLKLPENSLPPDTQGMIIPLALLFVALPYLGCLLWSTFFSLLTRKVIVALGLAAIAMIASYIFVVVCSVEIVGHSNAGHLQQPATGIQFFLVAFLPSSLALLLLGSNYLLTHRWLTRAFFDQASVKSPSFFKRWRVRRSGLDGGMVVEIGVEDRTAFEVVSPEVAIHQPPPRFGLSLLYALWGPNLWRHLRFLRWKEAIETRKIFLGFLLATLLITVWVTFGNKNSAGWHGVVGFFIHAASLSCGAMAFRAEQDDRKVQRLADMGLRPTTVWFSKHLVWFVRAVISVFAILFCTLTVVNLFGPSRSAGSIESFIQGVWLNTQLPDSVPIHNEIRLIGRAIILTLTMYGVGQVCSQLIRSTIVSMFVAFVLGLTAFGWAGVCFWFNVPFIISVMPLGIGCLLVTWSRTNSWMKDDNRPRVWTWPVASLAASLMLIYFGTGLFRVYEIPWSKPFFNDGTSAEFNDGLTAEQRAFVLAPVSAEEQRTFELYQRAADLMGKNTFRKSDGSLAASGRWAELSEDDRFAAEKAIQLAIEAAESPECAGFSPGTTTLAHIVSSTSGPQMSDVCDLFCFDADRELEAGHPEVALDRLRSAFAVARHAAGRGGERDWWLSHHMTLEVLRAVREWAKHSDIDRELIEAAIDIVDEHRQQMVPVEVMNYASAVMVRNTLDADLFTLTELLGDSHERLPVLLATKFPGESARSYRLLTAMEQHDVIEIEEYRNHQTRVEAGESTGMGAWYSNKNFGTSSRTGFEGKARALVRSTPLLALVASGWASGQLCAQDIRTECQVRATKIAIRLLLERRMTGKYPETLADFDESMNDPWSGKPFIWYPKGVPGNLMQENRVQLMPNTPFLITTGYSQSPVEKLERWQYRQDPYAITVGGRYPDDYVEYTVSGWSIQPNRSDIVAWDFPAIVE